MKILWALGPIALSTDPGLELCSVGDCRYRRVIGNLMVRQRPRAFQGSIRIGRASIADIDAVEAVLDAVGELLEESELDNPALERLHGLYEAASPGAQGRVLLGLRVLLDSCVDPAIARLDYKPAIKKGIWLQQRLSLVTSALELVGVKPWQG